jgi:hypothetical protein
MLEAAALDSVDIGYRRLHGEGSNVGGAYAEAATTTSRHRTGRRAAAGGNAGLGGGPKAKVDEKNYRRADMGNDV